MIDVVNLISAGKSLQSMGAPDCQSFTAARHQSSSVNEPPVDDLRERPGSEGVSRSLLYLRAWSSKALKVNNNQFEK